MSERIQDILQELAGLYDQRRRFVTLQPSDEPVFSVRELAEYRKTNDRIANLNEELALTVREGK
jgi:hypothetical protein